MIGDRKSTRLNSSHLVISYAVFCLKKKKKTDSIIENPQLTPLNRVVDLYTSLHDSCWQRRYGLVPRQPYCPDRLVIFFFFLMIGRPPRSTLFPSTTLFR